MRILVHYLIRCLVVCLSFVPECKADPNLVGWWKLDEASGLIAADSSGRGNHGTLNHMIGDEWTAGIVSGALRFAGTGGYINCGNDHSLQLVGDFSIAVWAMFASVDGIEAGRSQGIVGKYSNNEGRRRGFHLLRHNKSNRFTFRTTERQWVGGGVDSKNAYANDEWHHVTVVRSSQGLALYVDGLLEMASEYASLADSGDYLFIGKEDSNSNDPSESFQGIIDDVRIYTRALSPDEAFQFGTRLKAHDPIPADGTPDVGYGLDLLWEARLLRWTPGVGAVAHYVYIGTDPSRLSLVATGLTDPAYYYETLQAGTTYYWRVDEIVADGTTVHEGDVWHFSTLPVTASDPFPPNGAQNLLASPVLHWKAGVGSGSHEVYLGPDPQQLAEASPNSETYMGTQASTAYATSDLERGMSYYWRVDEVEPNGLVRYPGDVWSFELLPDLPIHDPDLMGWWKMDQGFGVQVIDWSGHDLHGYIHGGEPGWRSTDSRTYLGFDGIDDYVDLPLGPVIASLQDATFMLWVNAHPSGEVSDRRRHPIFSFSSDNGKRYMCLVPANRHAQAELIITTAGDAEAQYLRLPTPLSPGWTHVAITFNEDAARMYLNGEHIVSEQITLDPADIGETTANWLGKPYSDEDDRYFNGLLDDFRVYSRALSVTEIQAALNAGKLNASNPVPANGRIVDLDRAKTLSWTADQQDATYDIYLGTDPVQVTTARPSDANSIYQGRFTDARFSPSGLNTGQTYYWRVDTVDANAILASGELWRFTVADYLIVDDYEAYGNDIDTKGTVFHTWRDGLGYTQPEAYNGNGSGSIVGNTTLPYAERSIVHQGKQALPVYYDNGQAPYYSEVDREFAVTQDWTRRDVAALVLYFYGDQDNVMETLYLRVRDNQGRSAMVLYENHPSVVKEASWHEWNIDLREFQGIDVRQIKGVTIGLGDPVDPGQGGSGRIVFDDVILHQARCVPEKTRQIDLNQDCRIDYLDLSLLTQKWLVNTGDPIEPIDPGSSGLRGQWPLDRDARDALGKHHGRILGGPVWHQLEDRHTLEFAGSDTHVELPVGDLIGSLSDYTISTWVCTPKTVLPQPIFNFSRDKNGDGEDDAFLTLEISPRTNRIWLHMQKSKSSSVTISTEQNVSREWHHLAVTWEAASKSLRLLTDGTLVGQKNDNNTFPPEGIGPTTRNWLGRVSFGSGITANDWYYVGLMDDFRIYDQALSIDEIGWLTGHRSAFTQDLTHFLDSADLKVDTTNDDIVDFADFARIASHWQEEQLWP